jgi:hypothetical protein
VPAYAQVSTLPPGIGGGELSTGIGVFVGAFVGVLVGVFVGVLVGVLVGVGDDPPPPPVRLPHRARCMLSPPLCITRFLVTILSEYILGYHSVLAVVGKLWPFTVQATSLGGLGSLSQIIAPEIRTSVGNDIFKGELF